ncbi:MAG: DUF5312 domain-containing protein [Treponema sp.]|jgi:hypothetical protein|nr:DUF5312 domain-containing protein [Treponema sp.]
MADDRTFDQLAAELSLDERKNLLGKLSSHSSISSAPLYEEEEETNFKDVEARYAQLPWHCRLWCFLLSLFKAQPPVKVYENQQIAKLGREILESSPGLYDYQRSLLLTEFYNALQTLKEGARFFYTALDASVNRDKGAFYAFLGSLELGEIHNRLKIDTDPRIIVERNPQVPESEVRQLALGIMEDAIAEITEDQRKAMYHDARSLYCLKELAAFLFDRIIMAFSPDAAAQKYSCPANMVREQLLSLNNILYSIREPPPMPLLESLFVFILQERVGKSAFDINAEMRRLLSQAETAVVILREFNKQVPLTLILRCVSRDLSLTPKTISGGEDWFVVFRDYWKRHIEMQLAEYLNERRRQKMAETFRYFLKGTNLKMLGNTVSDTNPEGIPLKSALALSFLLSFYSAVFIKEINLIIRPILIDGEFYKPENRVEFTESYNDLIKLEDIIRKFEAELAPSGDYGKRYALAREEMSSLPVKRRKIQIVMEEVNEEADRIIEQTAKAMTTLRKILGEIIKKDGEGKYNALANMTKLMGKGNAFVTGLSESIEKLQKALQLLDDIAAMETEQ